jgi:hypothetical protein
MDDLDDQLLDQEEMNDMFSRPIGQDTFMTDADLENGIRKNKIDFFLIYNISISLKNWLALLKKNLVWILMLCLMIYMHPVFLFNHLMVVTLVQQRKLVLISNFDYSHLLFF